MTPRHIEDLEQLAGTRAGSTEAAAVRLRDLSSLMQLPVRLQSAVAAGATPTKVEFDALQADVAAIHMTLSAIALVLQAKQRR